MHLRGTFVLLLFIPMRCLAIPKIRGIVINAGPMLLCGLMKWKQTNNIYYLRNKLLLYKRMVKGTKKCPSCGERILAEAKKCRHCGEWLNRKELYFPTAQEKETTQIHYAEYEEQKERMVA